MKHHPFYLTIALLAILVFAGNCRKSEISFESNLLTLSISGRILDKDNLPVNEAEVKAGPVSVRTDVNGFFSLNNVRMPKDHAYVTVLKQGYFPGSRTFVANTKGVNYVNIRLIPKEITGSFNAAGGGMVNLPQGSSINFQPGSIINPITNSAYTGTVSVAAFFIDPTDAGFTSVMPGDLRGITTNNEERGLESFGMMAVELMDGSGNKLQLASGKTATVNFSIPAGLRATAPATIPLWWFDEEKGLWKEEGSATKQGNMYVGTVSHFSFWNCDAPFPLVDFQVQVKDQDGNPVGYAQVTIKKLSDATVGCGTTNSAGFVSGKIPANEPLQIKVFNRCQTLLFTQNIGPFSSNVNLGVITVPSQASQTVTISGTAVNCSNTAVTSGYVNVSLDGMNYRANISNGNFSVSIVRCISSTVQATLIATDLSTNQQSTSTSVSVGTGNVNAGQLAACGVTANEFVNYTLDGVASGFVVPGDSIVFYHIDSFSTKTNYLEASGGSESLSLQFDGAAAAGPHNGTHLIIIQGNKKYEGQNITVNITQFDAVGGFVIGNFTGQVQLGGSSTHNVSCNFKVKRKW